MPSVSRRSLLQAGLACACCGPRYALAREAAVLHEVAPGVLVRRGADEEASAGNANGIANIGCVIGRDAVLVFDAGGSAADGRWLRREIRRLTERPIRHVVISHAHPDHAFGACAFADDRPEVIGHQRLPGALQARAPYYRRRLVELLGEADAGEVVLPTRLVAQEDAIDLGDRRLRCLAHGLAHSDCDLTLLDEASGLLFPSDLLFVGRVPSLDGSVRGWLREAQRLRGLGATQAVPGHGPARVDFEPAMASQERYLRALRDGTRHALQQGIALESAIATVAASEREHWSLFDDYHGGNVTRAYKELEWE